MTINIIKNKLELVENEHQEKTMAHLSKLLKDKDMSQVELAKQLKRDKTTVNRWVKNSRDLAWDNAVEISKVLKCHPIELYQPSVKLLVERKSAWNGYMVDIPKAEQLKINVPFEWYNDEVQAVMMDAPGTPTDGEIWLFDIPKTTKKIHKNCVGQVCYITASKEFKKNNHEKLKMIAKKMNMKPTWHPLCGMIAPMGNGKLKVINSHNQELINGMCENLTYEDFEIAIPVKAKYNPILL